MSEKIYKRLAKHLDSLPGGFPPSPTGVELKILKKLFTTEEAELAVHATLIPEEAQVLARRAGLPLEEAASRLDKMARTGLLLVMERRGKQPKYMAAQYVIGIWEYHVNSLDAELIGYMQEYLPTLMSPVAWKKAPQLRTVPVGRSIEVRHSAMPYEVAEELVKAQKKILVAPCICRREHKIVGKGCDRIEESCLIFGAAADYYLKNSIGRIIEKEEALGILAKAEETGLVIQPSNSQKAINICLCCGCCCQILLGLKRMERPAEHIASTFVAKLDVEKCVGCGKCVKRCQMDAFTLADKKVSLQEENCIGCGLCVTTCKPGALVLERKPDAPAIPVSFAETMIAHGRARGKLSPTSLAWTALKSKLDRMLSSV